MTWKDEFNVEVSLLDQQHKKLFHVMEELRLGLTGRMQHGKVDEIVSTLTQYTEAHFLSEERLMQQTGYPDLAHHKLAHEFMTARIQVFRREMDGGNPAVSEELYAYLVSWWHNHILGTDKRYCSHFATKGIR